MKTFELTPFNAETATNLPAMVRSNNTSLVGERVSGINTGFNGLVIKETENAIQVVFNENYMEEGAKMKTVVPKSMLQVKRYIIPPVHSGLVVKDGFVKGMMKPTFIKYVSDMYDLLPA